MAMKKSMPKDVKGGASSAKKEMAKPAGKPRVEEMGPKGVIREVKDEERRWKAESALSDMERAEKHKSDPKLMKDVEAMRQKRMADLSRIKCETSPKTRY
jgi:rRNA maturation endonuclease Nob1